MTNTEAKQLSQVIRSHAARYPLMEPTDAVKLVYQSVFGGGHLITDPEASLIRLSAERAAADTPPDAPFIEIGLGRARMHLASYAFSALPDALLNRMFVLSAASPAGDMPQFRAALDLLMTLTKSHIFRFGVDDFSDYLRDYIASGCPMVSHSESYRRAYRPSYRVVDAVYEHLLPAVLLVQRSVASGAKEVEVPPESIAGISPERACTVIQALFDIPAAAKADPSGVRFLLVRP